MLPKQQEMDGIVRTVFEAIESKEHMKSTLFVLCGDHGMNDAGNHGASSPGETSSALVFLSPKLRRISRGSNAPEVPKREFEYYKMVEQSDITPTIAALLGIPISKNNLGAFIPEFLPFWSNPRDKVQILLRNGQQILNIITAAFGNELFDLSGTTDPCDLQHTDINAIACDWRQLNRQVATLPAESEMDPKWLVAMSSWLRDAQELMSSMASNYDLSKIQCGVLLAFVSTLCGQTALLFDKQTSNGLSMIPLAVMSASYGGMMFASSYVEEEQHFWYWASTFWVAWLGIRSFRR